MDACHEQTSRTRMESRVGHQTSVLSCVPMTGPRENIADGCWSTTMPSGRTAAGQQRDSTTKRHSSLGARPSPCAEQNVRPRCVSLDPISLRTSSSGLWLDTLQSRAVGSGLGVHVLFHLSWHGPGESRGGMEPRTKKGRTRATCAVVVLSREAISALSPEPIPWTASW